jgi:predicted  nucleic acid-binding Zn-ribbon protein
MFIRIVTAFVVVFALDGATLAPADAQELSAANIKTAQTGLAGARAEEAAAVKEISLVEESAAPKTKEQKLWNGEIEKLRPQYTAYDNAVTPHNADAAKQRAAVDKHNAGCRGTLPKPAYDRCKGEEGPLKAWGDRVHASKVGLDRRLADLNKRRDPILARAKALEAELAPLRARYNAAKIKLDQARQRVAKLEAWLQQARERCKNAKDLEALHHCNSVTWDGANPNLPPLGTPRPPLSATPN